MKCQVLIVSIRLREQYHLHRENSRTNSERNYVNNTMTVPNDTFRIRSDYLHTSWDPNNRFSLYYMIFIIMYAYEL